MRKGLTLIELILSMVIIGIVFTVIPRLVMSMNQSAQTTIKEEAMFNAMALMGAIINLPWDNNNTVNNQILNVTNGNVGYECNTTSAHGGALGYRIGGFIGGRDCRALPDNTYNFNASTILGRESDNYYNDIDDYSDVNASNDCAKAAGKSLYSIKPMVIYAQDTDPTALSIQLPGDDKNLTIGTSNIKRLIVKVGYSTDNTKKSGCITAFEYHSFNLGNIQINNSKTIGGW